MKKHKSLLIAATILGLITALATGAGKNLLSSKNALRIGMNSELEQPMVNMVEDEERGFADQVAPSKTGLIETSEMARPDMITNDSRVMPYPGRYLPPTGGGDALDVDERVYEKSSYHDVVVNDVSDYMRQIKEYILSIDGRVLSSNISTTEKYHYGYITAKVPAEKFEETTSRVTEKVKKVVSENLSAQDRTGQMVSTTTQVEKLEDQILEKEIQLVEAKTEAEKKESN